MSYLNSYNVCIYRSRQADERSSQVERYVVAVHCGSGGRLFGEVAALTGMQRTANVITEEESEFLIVPAKVMKRLAQQYAALNVMLHTTIGERLRLTELPRGTGFDQQLLRDLRTNQPEMKTEPASA